MRLSEQEAWTIATAWGEKLCGRVSLQVSDHKGRLHPRDEQWLTLELQKLSRRSVRLESSLIVREFVAEIREALDVWHALSCCAGYTGIENPVFWRRVVSHAHSQSHTRQLGVSDEFTFFSGDTFPRVRLCFEDQLAVDTSDESARDEAEHVDLVCREFFGLHSDTAASPPSAAFVRDMARLKPLISTARYARVIPVAIDLPSWDTAYLYPVVSELLAKLKRADANTRAARFQVQELSLDDMRVVTLQDDVVTAYHKWLQLPGIRITHWWWKFMPEMEVHYTTMPVRAIRIATGLDSSVVSHLETLVVDRGMLSSHQFAGLCAALPFARTLRHVKFFQLNQRRDWVWLAYAIFHENASSSSWRELSVDMCRLDGGDLDAMRAVRDRGASAMTPFMGHLGEQLSSRLERATAVQVLASKSATSFFPASDTTTCLDAFDLHTGTDVLCVIVPGFGLGWASSSAIAEPAERQASTSGSVRSSSLTHFRAMVMASTPQHLRDLICLLGSSCSSSRSGLAVVEVNDHVPVSDLDMHTILSSCPNLTSLNVMQEGSLWTTPAALDLPEPHATWPRLETLTVCYESSLEATELLQRLVVDQCSVLPGLARLRVQLLMDEEIHDPLHSELLQAAGELVRRRKTITHFTLHGVSTDIESGEVHSLPYDEYRHDVQTTLGIDDATLDVVNREARVAFLSVLRSESVITSSLSPELVSLIFSFMGRQPRNVWVEFGEDKEETT